MNFNDFKTVQGKCPMDLRRYIGKFFDKSKLNDPMRTLVSKSFLEYNLKELPQPTLVKLFVNGIYNKFINLYNNRCYFGVGTQTETRLMININTIPSPATQFVQMNLDTLYYGFTYSNDINHPKPQYKFDMNNNCVNMTYVPVTNHDTLTDHIRVKDFAILIRQFSELFDRTVSRSRPNTYKYMSNKSSINERDQILYEFVVILTYLGNKYRKINMEEKETAKKDKEEAKDEAKKEKMEAKEKAKKEKMEAKEKAKKEKMEAKEKAKKEKMEAKDKAKKEKMEAKEKAKKEKQIVK